MEILDARVDGGGQLDFAGVPAELMDELLPRVDDHARGRGLRRLKAIVEPDDAALDALVRRSGFTPRGEVLRMWRVLYGSVAEPAWPGGVRVRAFEDGDARPVQTLLDDAYAQRDAERVGLKVDSENPTGAVRLYARTGFEVGRRYGIWVKDL